MISVVCCTYNRDRVFEETIESFLACGTEVVAHELLLVDNNSTDRTRAIGERLASRLAPRVRYVNETRQGHPRAKNRGIREARGEIVAFIDDDVLVAPGWLDALSSAFARHPTIACIGGKVVPRFESTRPAWLCDEMLWIYGVTPYGEQERELRAPEVPIGCNMAFRRSVFDAIGEFHGALGRSPGSLLSGDEDHFLLRAERAGLRTLYVPDMVVTHRIPAQRLSRDWVLRRFYWGGISDVAKRELGDMPTSRRALVAGMAGIVADLARRLPETARTGLAILEGSERAPVVRQALLCERFGMLRQLAVEAARWRVAG